MAPKKSSGKSTAAKKSAAAAEPKNGRSTAKKAAKGAKPTGVSKPAAKKNSTKKAPQTAPREPRRSRRLAEREAAEVTQEPEAPAAPTQVPAHAQVATSGIDDDVLTGRLLGLVDNETGSENQAQGGHAPAQHDPAQDDESQDDTAKITSEPVEVSYGRRNAKQQSWLTGEIKVSDDDKHASKKKYEGKFFLKRPADSEPVRVGSLLSWRIDKSARQWIDDFLAVDISKVDKADAAFEATLCLQGLFNSNGELQRISNMKKQQLQGASEIVFLEMIVVEAAFQRQGLLSPILKLFRRMLREQRSFEGPMLLVPSRPEGRNGDVWGDMTDVDVEDELKRIYKAQDAYKTLKAEAKVNGSLIPIMGRMV